MQNSTNPYVQKTIDDIANYNQNKRESSNLEVNRKKENSLAGEKSEIGWIQTRSGIKFYPLDPKPSDIILDDIFWSLSGINRFLHHTSKSWSVGQHSLLGALWLYYKYQDKKLACIFLVHDASEAYLNDLPRPLKVLPQFAFYREAEANLQQMIYDKFIRPVFGELTLDEKRIIADTDRLMLYVELSKIRDFLHTDSEYFPGNEESIKLGLSEFIAEMNFDSYLDFFEAKTTYQKLKYYYSRWSQ